MSDSRKKDGAQLSSKARREILRKLGRFTAVTAPAVTLLLAAQTKASAADIRSGVQCQALAQLRSRKVT